MSIVFITIPGQQKIEFANLLHSKTNKSVKLVIVQKTKYVPWSIRFNKLLKTVGWKNIFVEFYYVLFIRLNSKYRNYLKYFFLRTQDEIKRNFNPKVLEVDDVNSLEVYNILQELKPKLLIVWGTNVLKPNIFNCAENAINLHMGIGQHFRGAVANHFAVLEDKKETIGAMIHKIDNDVDTGDVYKLISADLKLPPKYLFTKLNDEALRALLDVSIKLHNGKILQTFKQDLVNSKNVLLREWTPSRRFQVAKIFKDWEDETKK